MNIVEDVTKTIVTRHISVQLDEQAIVDQLKKQINLPDGFKVTRMAFASEDLGTFDINEVVIDVVLESSSATD